MHYECKACGALQSALRPRSAVMHPPVNAIRSNVLCCHIAGAALHCRAATAAFWQQLSSEVLAKTAADCLPFRPSPPASNRQLPTHIIIDPEWL